MLRDKAFIICAKTDEDEVFSVQINHGLPEELKRKGLGTKSYLSLSRYYGSLRSGNALTGEALDFWSHLVKNHGAKVISWHLDNAKNPLALYEDFKPSDFKEGAKYDSSSFSYRFELKR